MANEPLSKADEARNDWVRRVLGVDARARAPVRPPLMPLWRQAKEAVDGQLARLEKALRDTGLPLGARIADRGLISAFGGEYVGFAAALTDFDRADVAKLPDAAATLRDRTARLRAALSKTQAIEIIERNPLGVPVLARAMLFATLDRIAAAAGA